MYVYIYMEVSIPQNGWFIRELPTKMDDLGVPLFQETPIYTLTYIHTFWLLDRQPHRLHPPVHHGCQRLNLLQRALAFSRYLLRRGCSAFQALLFHRLVFLLEVLGDDGEEHVHQDISCAEGLFRPC